MCNMVKCLLFSIPFDRPNYLDCMFFPITYYKQDKSRDYSLIRVKTTMY
ncbi:hypothetical protein HanXRQr2_Chr05g0193941 [Helianthus annuus]|uniref:Uncharacterized protein n=1 Tax=Helianthus annuus TaxID=4232 RepID=A0A9K3IVW1_HELAN|nr:hypothetical protein HanXRQr2_Chr05g0193941 [Helianthus annuus]